MKSFANTSRKLLWVSHVSFCPLFSLLLHRFECLNARVCVCLIWVLLVRRWLLKWYKLLSLCSALTLEVNHHNRENSQFMRCKYSIPSILWRPLEGEVKWLSWMMNTKLFSPLPKKPPILINAGDVCWAEHMRCFCLFIIPTGNALIGLNSSTYSRERLEDAKSTAANFAFKHERREEIRGNQQFTFALTIQC